MKTLEEYVKKHHDAIMLLLKIPPQLHTADSFYQLRLQIKKINAAFELVKFCEKDFRQKKIFKPYKTIFKQAGKARELHVAALMLNEYFIAGLLKNYQQYLDKLLAKEQALFFSLVKVELIEALDKRYYKAHPSFASVDEHKVHRYIRINENGIQKILREKDTGSTRLHDLRKQLKKVTYICKGLKLEAYNQSGEQKDILSHLLGQWHDYEVTTGYLKKALHLPSTSTIEKDELKKIISIFTAGKKSFLQQINAAKAAPEFHLSHQHGVHKAAVAC
jgi:CHAD domain-containing protein